ncbi:MAG: response regulator [Lachnospiraceae bacterium]|nr:response regulator [Lachnospiraceae bacterium]
MLRTVIYSLLCIEMLVAISQAIMFQVRVKDVHAINRQIIISGAFSLQCVTYIAMMLVQSDFFRYLLYAICWYAGVCLVANLTNMAAYSLNYNGRFVRHIISVIYYLGMVIYFADTFLSKGDMIENAQGICYPPYAPLSIILHAVFDVIYLVGLCYIYVYFNHEQLIKRERHLMRLWLLTFAFSAVGIFLELLDLLFFMQHFPYMLFVCIGTILLMPKLLIYHRRILIREEDYEEVLKENGTDLVFVCDDNFRVVFMNKRAQIVGQVIKQDFAGQSIPDIYLMSPETEERLYNNSVLGAYSIPAIYAPLNRKITMEVRPIYDKFHELFTEVITVYGMEDQEASTAPIEEVPVSTTVPDEPESEFKIARGARLLMVNENSIRMNVFEKMLQPYSATVNRALSAHAALEDAQSHTYDMIFIDQNLSEITAFELAEKIRSMPGEYYREVPLVYTTDIPMDEQYKEFLGAGFSDYLQKPVSAKQLNHVLTRWLWKRFAKAEESDHAGSDMKELELLLADCDTYYEKKNKLLFASCLRALRQQCVLWHLPEYESDARELYRAFLIDENAVFDKRYRSFSTSFRTYIEQQDGAAAPVS